MCGRNVVVVCLLGMVMVVMGRQIGPVQMGTWKVEGMNVGNHIDPILENVTQLYGIQQKDPSFKFGGPCVADLDGDGAYDLILSNHNGKPTRVYMQKKERNGFILSDFRTIYLDIHGVAVGRRTAIDNDRLLGISVGGGTGTNLKVPEMYIVNGNGEFKDVSNDLGFGQRTYRGRNILFMDLARRTREEARANLGGMDLLMTGFLGNRDVGLRQFAYENEKGEYKIREVPGFELEKRGRIEVTDMEGQGDIMVISIRDMTFYKLIAPFKFQDVTNRVLDENVVIKTLTVTSVVELDFDNDGFMDLFVARADRNRMTLRPADENAWNGDVLLRNNGQGKYVNVTGDVGIVGEGDSMGVTCGDFNNDGYVDLFVVEWDKEDYFWMNNGNGTFRKVQGLVKKDPDTVGNHAVAADLDSDGKVDLVIGHGHTDTIKGRYVVMKNVLETEYGNWLLVRVGNEPSGSVTALLAVVKVYVDGQIMMRRIGSRGAQGGGASLIDTVHFGLGMGDEVDAVSVVWSNGLRQRFGKVAANQRITVGLV